MTYPSVINVETQVSPTTNVTSFTVDMSGHRALCQVRDDIWVFLTVDANPTSITASPISSPNWVKPIAHASRSVVTGALFKLSITADGVAEDLVVNLSSSQQWNAISYLVRAPGGITSLTPTTANGASSNANPPASSTNGTGAALDALVIASAHIDQNIVASAAPSGYTDLHTAVAGAFIDTGSTSTAQKNVNIADAGNTDPGTFTSSSDDWVTWTVALYDAQAAILATAAATFAALTTTSAAKLEIHGASGANLAALTTGATGHLVQPGTGDVLVTLDPVTLVATMEGEPVPTAALDQTLAPLTCFFTLAEKEIVYHAPVFDSSIGAYILAGILVGILEGEYVDRGKLPPAGQFSLTFGALTITATGAYTALGQSDITLGILTTTSSGGLFDRLLLEGDQQTGGDRLLLEGDQSGYLLLEGTY